MPDDDRQLFSAGSTQVPRYDPGNFDFDAWAQLAQSDVAGYFEARRTAIDSFIDSAPDHAKSLRQLQIRIDNVRACAGSPLKAASQISDLMRNHAELLGHQFDLLRQEIERLCSRTSC